MSFLNDKGARQPRENDEIVRLKNQIAAENNRIDYIYHEIGRIYCALHPQNYESAFEQPIKDIEESRNKIRDYETQILRLQGLVRCPRCNANVPINSVFCNMCGQSLKPAAPEPQLRRCPRCGETVKHNMKFCNMCGCLLPDAPVQPAPVPMEPVDKAPASDAPAPVPAPDFNEPNQEPAFEPEVIEREPVNDVPVWEEPVPDRKVESDDEDQYLTQFASSVPPVQEKPSPKRCPNCGFVEDDPEMLFCTECGTRLE